MTFLLPLVAFALALAAPFVLRSERGGLDGSRLGALALLLLLGAAVVLKGAPAADRTPALIGLALGALAPLLGAWTGGIAAGVAGAAALHLFPAAPAMGLAFVAGTGLGALAVGGEAAALAGVLVFAADRLGAGHSQVPAAAFVGSQVGVALAVGAFLAAFLPLTLRLARPVLAGILVTLAGLLVARGLTEPSLTLCAGLGALAGVVLHFLMPEEEGESSRVGLAAIVGVGLATVAFGLGRGLGMGLAGLASVGVLLAVGNRRAVMALGPLVGLILYRVLREAGTGATRALDIGQHYTMLALLLGLVLPLLPTDWLQGRGRAAHATGLALWGVVALAAAPLVVVAFGMRGGIGFVVGLGAAGLVEALRVARASVPADRESLGTLEITGTEARATSLLPLAVGAGIGGSAILALLWLGDESTLSRDAKLHLFAYAAVGIALIAGMLALAGRLSKESN